MHAARMLLEAKQWIEANMPWWQRRGGRDHIWLVTHDEASCWVPAALRPSIILSHWGRKVRPDYRCIVSNLHMFAREHAMYFAAVASCQACLRLSRRAEALMVIVTAFELLHATHVKGDKHAHMIRGALTPLMYGSAQGHTECLSFLLRMPDGLQDAEHMSNTAFAPDNYSSEFHHAEWSPDGWLDIIEGHACYDPAKVRPLTG